MILDLASIDEIKACFKKALYAKKLLKISGDLHPMSLYPRSCSSNLFDFIDMNTPTKEGKDYYDCAIYWLSFFAKSFLKKDKRIDGDICLQWFLVAWASRIPFGPLKL